MMRFLSIVLTLLCSITLIESPAVCRAGENEYETHVKPLLRERCFACHGALKQEGGLRLDTAEFIKRGGDSGAAIDVKAGPEASFLIERVTDEDPSYRMPPEFEGEPLSAEEIELLSRWIQAGAPAPADEAPEKDPSQHWAFQPVEKPPLPAIDLPEWEANPIDVWIAKGHAEQGLTPQAPVDRLQLLRRVTYDLIGLPPTAEQITACLNDSSPDWYENTVDRLLEDPRHGERWARHWMDVWRYSDWWGLGKQLRNSQKNIWHWRDWIIESVNEDLPYDEMVRLMLAADELAPGDPDKLRATGFLARNYYIFNRMRWMDETVEHVGKGLLGLTMNCAKCHDHKFDPIEQVDYYKMRAFFEPYLVRQDMVPGQVDFNQDGIPRAFDALLDAPTYLYVRGDESQPDTSNALEPGVPDILEFDSLQIEEVKLPAVASQPARQPWVFKNHIAAAEKQVKAAEAKQAAAAKALDKAEAAANGPAPELASETQNDASFEPLRDDFTQLDTSRWKTVTGTWQLEADGLRQTTDGPQRSILQLLQDVPRNFDATLRFRLHGGSRYRSVGLAFDAPPRNSADLRFLVYASGFADDQKVQAAFDDGKWNYPGDGRQSITLDLETDYTLRLQVRGTLMNVALNGEPMLAWKSPVGRDPGTLQLITFDALATLQQFEITELPADAKLVPPGNSSNSADPLVEARLELALATARYNEALANANSVRQRAAAMQAAWNSNTPDDIEQAQQAAIRAERELAVATAQIAVVEAEGAVARATDDAKAEAEAKKKLTEANSQLAKAKTALEGDFEKASFTPLPGAKWSATRFQHTGRDDPEVKFPQTSTGRRTALAKWITDQRNPLTARVAVNHIWTRHFGQPLVPTTFDFGRNGIEPVHTDLLNWLAADFMEHGWSMKRLHRLIVLSKTYRMGSSPNGKTDEMAQDPDNHYWWRRAAIRHESQVVRDSVLALAGTLDETIGGPPVLPKDQDGSKRRSLYFFHSNNERNLFLTTFDEASVAECYQREQSVVPQQALALSNSALVLDASQKIAAQLSAAHDSDEAFIQQAFLLLLGFEAADKEIADCTAALASWEQLPDGSRESARANLVWTLLNHNDFVTLR